MNLRIPHTNSTSLTTLVPKNETSHLILDTPTTIARPNIKTSPVTDRLSSEVAHSASAYATHLSSALRLWEILEPRVQSMYYGMRIPVSQSSCVKMVMTLPLQRPSFGSECSWAATSIHPPPVNTAHPLQTSSVFSMVGADALVMAVWVISNLSVMIFSTNVDRTILIVSFTHSCSFAQPPFSSRPRSLTGNLNTKAFLIL